jgi:hypothetical protein
MNQFPAHQAQKPHSSPPSQPQPCIPFHQVDKQNKIRFLHKAEACDYSNLPPPHGASLPDSCAASLSPQEPSSARARCWSAAPVSPCPSRWHLPSHASRCHRRRGDPACFPPSPAQYGTCLPCRGTQQTTTDAEATPNGFKRTPYDLLARRDRHPGDPKASTIWCRLGDALKHRLIEK